MFSSRWMKRSGRSVAASTTPSMFTTMSWEKRWNSATVFSRKVWVRLIGLQVPGFRHHLFHLLHRLAFQAQIPEDVRGSDHRQLLDGGVHRQVLQVIGELLRGARRWNLQLGWAWSVRVALTMDVTVLWVCAITTMVSRVRGIRAMSRQRPQSAQPSAVG